MLHDLAAFDRQPLTLVEAQPFAPTDAYVGDVARANGRASDGPDEFVATAFDWPDPASLPRRRWLLGRWLLRGEVTAIVAPGGVGKSALGTGLALSLASGQPILGLEPFEGTQGAWVINLEDGPDELARQVTAAGQQHGIGRLECAGRLFIDSGLTQPLCTAIETPAGAQIVEPVFQALAAEMKAREIAALIVDPFVASHAISENDNGAVGAVAIRWKRLAEETGAAIVLVHHVRKLGGREATVEDSRGAGAMIGAARIGLALNAMSAEEAERFGIMEPSERRRLVRVDMGKANRAPPEAAWWMKLTSVDLGNGDEQHPSDHIGVAVQWTPPDAFEGISPRQLFDVQQRLGEQEYAENVNSADWVGHAVAEVIGADLSEPGDKARVKALIRGWKASGALKTKQCEVPGKGRTRPVLVTGEPVDPATLPSPKTGVGKLG